MSKSRRSQRRSYLNAVRLASAIRDKSKVEEFLREVATKVGLDVDQVRAEHRRSRSAPQPQRAPVAQDEPTSEPAPFASFGAPEFADEREALKVFAQYPHLAGPLVSDVAENDFTHPVAQELWRTFSAHGWPEQPDPSWVPRISDALPSEDLRRVLSVAAVEPLRMRGDSPAVIASIIAQLQALTLARRITELKSKLQRTNPVEQTESYNRMFGELIALEQQHRTLRDRAIGA